MATVATLLIDIAANTAKLQQDMATAQNTVEKAMKGIESAANIAKTALGALGVATTLAGLKGMVTSTAEAIGALKTLSEQTGVSVERLSAFRSVAKYADTDLGSVATGIQKLSKTMMEAATNSNSSVAKIFQALGVEVQSANGSLRSADEVMQQVARTFTMMADETQRVAVAQQLFGKAGAQLLPFLLELGRAGELNAKITTEQAEAAKLFDDNLKRLGAASQAWKVQLVNDMLPTLNKFLEQMIEGQKIAGGFAQAMMLFGVALAPGTGLKELNARLGELIEKKKKLAESSLLFGFERDIRMGMTDQAIAGVQKQIEFTKYLERQRVLAKTSDADLDARDLRLRQKINIPLPADEAKTPKVKEQRQNDDYFRALQAEQRILEEANEFAVKYLLNEQKKQDAAQALADRLTNGLNPAMADYNKVVDEVNQAVEAGTLSQELADAVLQQAGIRYQEATAKGDAYRQMVEALDRAYGEIRTPQEQYAKALADIAILQAEGRMNEEQAKRQQIKAAEDLARGLRNIGDETKSADDLAKSLGMTFSSAFEDAIVKGRGVRDILAGILQDISRIILRTQVSQPAAGAIAKFAGTFISSYFGTTAGVTQDGWTSAEGGTGYSVSGTKVQPRASGGPVSAGMPYLIGEDGPELMVPGTSGTVVPNGSLGGVTVNQTINVTTGVQATVRAEIMQMMPAIQRATTAAVVDARLRGGAVASAFA